LQQAREARESDGKNERMVRSMSLGRSRKVGWSRAVLATGGEERAEGREENASSCWGICK
jgi:hypothetical protein